MPCRPERPPRAGGAVRPARRPPARPRHDHPGATDVLAGPPRPALAAGATSARRRRRAPRAAPDRLWPHPPDAAPAPRRALPGRSDPGRLATARRPATPRCRRRRPSPHAQRFHLAPAHRRSRPAMAAHHRLPSPRCRRAVAPTGRGPRNGTRCCPRPHPGATPDRPRGTGRHHAPCRALQHGSQQRVPAPAGAARRRVIECPAPATARAVPANNTRNSPYPGNPAEPPSTDR